MVEENIASDCFGWKERTVGLQPGRKVVEEGKLKRVKGREKERVDGGRRERLLLAFMPHVCLLYPSRLFLYWSLCFDMLMLSSYWPTWVMMRDKAVGFRIASSCVDVSRFHLGSVEVIRMKSVVNDDCYLKVLF